MRHHITRGNNMQDTIEDIRTTVREAHTRYDEAGVRWSIDAENETREYAIRHQATVLNKVLEQLARYGYAAEGEAVERAFGMMHRTHQQDFLRNVILPILHRLDDDFDTGNFDARNEAACQFARTARDANAATTSIPRI